MLETSLNCLKPARNQSEQFETGLKPVWTVWNWLETSLNCLKAVWTVWNRLETSLNYLKPAWNQSELFETALKPVWTVWNHFKTAWTGLNFLKPVWTAWISLKCLKQFELIEPVWNIETSLKPVLRSPRFQGNQSYVSQLSRCIRGKLDFGTLGSIQVQTII